MVLRLRAAGLKADSRRFWIGVAGVALLHAALIVGFVRSEPRYLGEPEGSQTGISVELIDAADLASLSTVRPAQPSMPGSAPPPSPPPREAVPRPEPKEAAVPPIEADTPGSQAPPPARQDSPPAPPAKSRPSLLDLSPSLRFDLPDGAFAPGGRPPDVTRPPNVTRSRENSEFGRGVIRALYKTMPKADDTVARVTVRLFLSEHGNLTELQLVRSSGDPILDQNVMFAARQSSFPIPPAGATLADRTFLVTYIYR
jgi:periplasmic protein TonB